MKHHAIIPIFIPHEGCPNDCCFCNQRVITAHQRRPSRQEMVQTIETWLSTLSDPRPEIIEIALYGGSFTGLPRSQQAEYLSVAQSYKKSGRIDQIHLSTRPDYIDEDTLRFLRAHQVDVIELGAQSFDDRVLRLANRGHGSDAIYESSRLIRAFGFTLGIQLMVGLPGDTLQTALFSAREAVTCEPSIARLYPTVILQDTALFRMYERGDYVPFSQEEMIHVTKEMYCILSQAGIRIIRVGLKSSDLVREGSGIAGGSYHPAFRHLVEGEIAREDLELQLKLFLKEHSKNNGEGLSEIGFPSIVFSSHPSSFSNLIGNSRRNKLYFQNHYPALSFRFQTDPSLSPGVYQLTWSPAGKKFPLLKGKMADRSQPLSNG